MPIKTQLQSSRGLKGVAVGGGLRLSPGGKITVTDVDDVPYNLVMDVRLVDGRYECEDLTVTRKKGGDGVTADGLREVRLGRIIAHALQPFVLRVTENPARDGEYVAGPVGPWDDENVRVAAIYRLAYACGLRPTKEVAEALGVSASVAGNRVMKARRAGLLGETVKGKAQPGDGA